MYPCGKLFITQGSSVHGSTPLWWIYNASYNCNSAIHMYQMPMLLFARITATGLRKESGLKKFFSNFTVIDLRIHKQSYRHRRTYLHNQAGSGRIDSTIKKARASPFVSPKPAGTTKIQSCTFIQTVQIKAQFLYFRTQSGSVPEKQKQKGRMNGLI